MAFRKTLDYTTDNTLEGRMGKEAFSKALEQQKNISEKEYATIKYLAEFAVRPMFRTPVHKTPSAHGIHQWEDIHFPSSDGTPLEGWYIPSILGESDKLIIINHPMPMSRSGFTGYLGEPFSSVDTLEIDFVAHMKHLSEAGYNILAYDLRNHGNSGAANGGICGIGRYEWRDVVGAQNYVNNHPKLSGMKCGLYNRCTGGNAAYEAMYRQPGLFENILCFFGPMTVSMTALMTSFAGLMGLQKYMELMDLEQLKLGGFTNGEMHPQKYAHAVKVPYFMAEVLDDDWTDNPRDAQEIFDNISATDKELFWIENTNRRFDGYNYFGVHPEKMIAFFDKYMK
ncbi:alpha/beta hydrolase [Muricauda sp. SCSIO 64092]|uniref:alpha/beta hydrolase family protein n=1 Tax=Allomuricauda sp. SCSIO 64092 TaxID=2908842 RepID=UPI001FF349DA|nr:alpha/beta hydrolase [Muricauda sp. SCSIO 64092]UOY06864.1 alpha/beta hydrolase [Muricauda sp. SCSIO 64092]